MPDQVLPDVLRCLRQPPMDLYLLRHAIAVERGTPGFEADHLRPLTPEGRSKMAAGAAGMKVLKLRFALIFTSPYVRARETADIVAATLRLKRRLRVEESLRADHSPPQFAARLAVTCADEDAVLAVGHEPYLSSLASWLVGVPARPILALKKGGLCKLTVSGLKPRPQAQIDWLLTPRQLRMLA